MSLDEIGVGEEELQSVEDLRERICRITMKSLLELLRRESWDQLLEELHGSLDDSEVVELFQSLEGSSKFAEE
jgi:hypothetical protein|tara:strand:+ start:1726 stop:1944 length:219 start_codon:yes stop_codon:yes gene_type:complete